MDVIRSVHSPPLVPPPSGGIYRATTDDGRLARPRTPAGRSTDLPGTAGPNRTNTEPMTETAECVGCGEEVPVPDGAETGAIVDCPTCGTELEVVDVDPPAVELASGLDEDGGEH